MYVCIVQIGGDSSSKNTDFPKLVSAMTLSSVECVKCV